LDDPTLRALEEASRFSHRLVAVHIRCRAEPLQPLEVAWARGAPSVPLVVVEADTRDWRRAFVDTVLLLRRTERADRLTIVVPSRAADRVPGRRSRFRLRLPATHALRLALLTTPGVFVRP
jgi:hypothetical protein